MAYDITTVTSNTTANSGFDLFFLDASSGNLTLTLYDVSSGGFEGSSLYVRRLDSTGNTATVAGFSVSQTIDGAPSTNIGISKHFQYVVHNNKWYSISM